jgi:hypothetical protein
MGNKINWYPDKEVSNIEPTIDQVEVNQPVESRENLAKRINKLFSNLLISK